jgi:signal transduction histidine kinase
MTHRSVTHRLGDPVSTDRLAVVRGSSPDSASTGLSEVERENALLRVLVAERSAELSTLIEELERANRARTDFLANVSHELRTPLTAILGFSELLASGLDGPLTSRQHEDAATVMTNARTLLGLVDDLIDLSRIESARVELRTESVDVAEILARVVSRVRSHAGVKGIHLILDHAPDRILAEADATRVETILLAVLGNAVKFTPPGGTVRASAWLEESADDAPPVARIDVVDSGVGIAESDHDRIFEKFQRLGGPEQPGTGLGLTIARGLARLQGGTLTVDSTLGLGSRFTLRLPCGPAGAPE